MKLVLFFLILASQAFAVVTKTPTATRTRTPTKVPTAIKAKVTPTATPSATPRLSPTPEVWTDETGGLHVAKKEVYTVVLGDTGGAVITFDFAAQGIGGTKTGWMSIQFSNISGAEAYCQLDTGELARTNRPGSSRFFTHIPTSSKLLYSVRGGKATLVVRWWD